MSLKRLLQAGAWLWVSGGIGHLVVVDGMAVHGASDFFILTPTSDVYEAMRRSVMSWGWLGSTTVFDAFSGFSVWVFASCALIGVMNLLIAEDASRAPGLARRVTLCNGIGAAVLTVVAMRCWITPPVVVGTLATGVYAAAFWRTR